MLKFIGWTIFRRIVIAQQLYGFAANGARQSDTFGKFGIIADVTGDAFPEDVFCIPIRGTNGQELLFACFFQVVGRARLAESSLPLPDLNTSVRIDAVPFFRIDAYANVRCFEIDPHPPRTLRRNELADMFRRLCMPADYGVDFSGLENFFGFRLPESIAEDGQFPESFR